MFLQRGDPLDLDRRTELHLVPGHGRAPHEPGDLGVHLELVEHLGQRRDHDVVGPRPGPGRRAGRAAAGPAGGRRRRRRAGAAPWVRRSGRAPCGPRHACSRDPVMRRPRRRAARRRCRARSCRAPRPRRGRRRESRTVACRARSPRRPPQRLRPCGARAGRGRRAPPRRLRRGRRSRPPSRSRTSVTWSAEPGSSAVPIDGWRRRGGSRRSISSDTGSESGAVRRSRTRSRSARSRAGTALTGVAVMTSTPNASSRSSRTPAIHGPSAATSGTLATKPSRPPAARIACSPSEGRGVPWTTCTSPTTESTTAAPPMTTRPVEAASSGRRRIRKASASTSSGTAQDREPNRPVTNAVTRVPTGPVSPHHVTAATTTAAPTSARPRPSRRCAGSRSRALRPRRRAAPPTRWARPSQTAATARARAVMIRLTGPGPREGRRAGARRAGGRLAAGRRAAAPLAVRLRAEPLRAALGEDVRVAIPRG